MKPEELDVVKLLRPLPEHNLPTGSTGTVVIDHTMDSSNKDLPPAYMVEFMDSDGITTLAVVTVYEKDLEVVWRYNKDK
jgi:Domain of unknown function (DUF4926)